MNTPKVSVLMSVYNGERYLGEAIDSILNQTFTDFEFVIIDDASTDSTAAILDSYPDARLVRLKNETNLGLTQSLNRGLAVVRGEYVARMDADDISLPERLAKQVNYLDTHPEVGVVGAQVNFIDTEGRSLGPVTYPTDPLLIDWTMLLSNRLWHPLAMFRRDLVQTLGGYNQDFAFAQDYDLWLRLRQVAQIRLLPDFLLKYRAHANSASTERFVEQERCLAAIVRQHTGPLLSRPLTDELIFAMRQLLGIYPPGIHPVFQAAIDTLLEMLAAFSRQRQLSQTETQQVSRYVAESLICFAGQAEGSLLRDVLLQAIQLDGQVMANYVTNLRQANADQAARILSLETQRVNLEHLLASKETEIQIFRQNLDTIQKTKTWQLALKWYALKRSLVRSK